MKKTYKNLIGVALSTILCLSLAMPANAQRGGEHSDGKSSGGGSTPPPAAPQMQRPAPQPQAQPQMQRPAPQPQQQAQPQMQRPAPQPQQQAQPQMQRGNQQVQQQVQQQAQPQMQRSNAFGGQQRPNAVSGYSSEPRGSEHKESPVFTPANPRNNNNGNYSQRQNGQNGFNYNHGNNGYRSYPGLENYAAEREHGFYYRNRGYYGTYYTPQLGFSLSVLPYGYYPFYYGQNQYFYSDGLYYQQYNDNYTIVAPPIGAVINRLPSRAQSITINGVQYYELNGIYYLPVRRDDGKLVYQIAGKDGELTTADNGSAADDLPQVGDLVDNLPRGCKALRLNGRKYYVSQEGYYFQDAVDSNGDKVFEIISTPNDGQGN